MVLLEETIEEVPLAETTGEEGKEDPHLEGKEDPHRDATTGLAGPAKVSSPV